MSGVTAGAGALGFLARGDVATTSAATVAIGVHRWVRWSKPRASADQGEYSERFRD